MNLGILRELHSKIALLIGALCLLGVCGTTPVVGQVSDTAPAMYEGQRPIATRADLEAALAQAEQIVASEGYSQDLREQKRAEAGLIRSRLTEGDFLVGDQIIVQVPGDSALSGTLTVAPGRVISIPGFADISMRGVLRSEAQSYLREQFARYLKDPEVRARTLIRLSVLGGVAKPGFYQLDAEMLLSDALQSAGGITNATDLKKSYVNRDDETIVSKETFYQAITVGRTLDDLNLRAGDEITVGQVTPKDWFKTLRTILLVPAAIASVYGMGKLFGVF